MAKIPVRFKRVAEAFDKEARARVCGERSGSEHQWRAAESLTDLSDLVNSFIESGHGEEIHNCGREGINRSDCENDCGNSENTELLRGILECEGKDDNVKKKIRAEVESACDVMGSSSSPEFKQRLMSSLRQRGFDAGLCKSKWEKTGRSPPGNHEYVDINIAGTRYVVEVFLAGEFEIARPTDTYASLLHILPPIFVGKLEELKQIVRLMCNAIKKSLECWEMNVPPWRRYVYMKAKWFSSYNRTINEVSDKNGTNSGEDSATVGEVGFIPLPGIRSYYCREDFGSKVGLRVGNLAMAMNGTGLRL